MRLLRNILTVLQLVLVAHFVQAARTIQSIESEEKVPFQFESADWEFVFVEPGTLLRALSPQGMFGGVKRKNDGQYEVMNYSVMVVEKQGRLTASVCKNLLKDLMESTPKSEGVPSYEVTRASTFSSRYGLACELTYLIDGLDKYRVVFFKVKEKGLALITESQAENIPEREASDEIRFLSRLFR